MPKNKKEAGFIPLLILLVLILAVIIGFSFKHVADARRAKTMDKINSFKQDANIIDR